MELCHLLTYFTNNYPPHPVMTINNKEVNLL